MALGSMTQPPFNNNGGTTNTDITALLCRHHPPSHPQTQLATESQPETTPTLDLDHTKRPNTALTTTRQTPTTHLNPRASVSER